MAVQLLTNVSIAAIYRGPGFSFETISQSHLGESLEIIDEKSDWFRVRQEDGYEGWVARFFVVEKPTDWGKQNFYHNSDHLCWIYQSPDDLSTTLRDMTLLSEIPILDFVEGWVQVLLPDGAKGWVKNRPRSQVKSLDVEQLVETACSFLGIQYLWGGRSPKGFDCSGFVQTTFGLHGLRLPRDAYLQAEVGQKVDDDFNLWQVGDLIFFTENQKNISHVAISLGKGDFIHSSGYVKLNSFNPDHKDLYLEKYIRIHTKTMRAL
ncbi:MAG: C40 family peptidase [Candidatus Marinimicrobia bacterium]|nr:C40 family peptidase [Candidatus Neomarinimicrobiota bacterium]